MTRPDGWRPLVAGNVGVDGGNEDRLAVAAEGVLHRWCITTQNGGIEESASQEARRLKLGFICVNQRWSKIRHTYFDFFVWRHFKQAYLHPPPREQKWRESVRFLHLCNWDTHFEATNGVELLLHYSLLYFAVNQLRPKYIKYKTIKNEFASWSLLIYYIYWDTIFKKNLNKRIFPDRKISLLQTSL